jgi:hypothetical protein
MGAHQKRLGEYTDDIMADLTFQRHVGHLHALGPRVVGELLAQLGAEKNIRTAIDQMLARYAKLTSEQVKAAGGDKWPPAGGSCHD